MRVCCPQTEKRRSGKAETPFQGRAFLEGYGHERISDEGKEQDPVILSPIEVRGQTYQMTGVSMGNPHAIVYMDDLKDLDIEKIGPKFENHIAFPDRINTEFVKVIDRHTLQMRVWERGSGETLACGTGACAVAVASTLNGLVDEDQPVTVKLLGGDLQILWNRQENLVYMTGSATTVFDGEIDVSFLEK